jgi:hypothetical protein
MNNPLPTYLCDHLAGANFALELLEDLKEQKIHGQTAALAEKLYAEVDEDRGELEGLVNDLGESKNLLKDAAGWVAQKASRFKLRLQEPIGIFEAVELLSLGVLGKRALWRALQRLDDDQIPLGNEKLELLALRAEQQHALLEDLRLCLARLAFADERAAI